MRARSGVASIVRGAAVNPRRVHDLMRRHFPPIEHATRTWTVVQDAQGLDGEALSALLTRHVGPGPVLIEVRRKEGVLLPVGEVADYIRQHLGEGEIRVADRDFTGFVVVAQNGVATGWMRADALPAGPDGAAAGPCTTTPT